MHPGIQDVENLTDECTKPLPKEVQMDTVALERDTLEDRVAKKLAK
jgi:hypothetical protein